jgi:hypothetical protein
MSNLPAQTFDEWFELQHGPRVPPDLVITHYITDKELRNAYVFGQKANLALANRELWDKQRQSALYALKAREKVGAWVDVDSGEQRVTPRPAAYKTHPGFG